MSTIAKMSESLNLKGTTDSVDGRGGRANLAPLEFNDGVAILLCCYRQIVNH